MLLCANAALEENKQRINELNVFPVPDGDTGTNMSLTMNSAAIELGRKQTDTVGAVADCAASALLRGARGNSGVILSLLFRGIAKSLKGRENANAAEFAAAVSAGVDAAYKAVMKPAEGTILTVSRLGAQAAVELCLSMAGAICLWSGVMTLMDLCGLSQRLARLLRPVLRHILPRASWDSETMAALSANVSANLLGLGNAATPLGIRAARRMSRGCGGSASNELCLLVVLNTASIQLLPTTAAALRSACGAENAFDILPAVWISSAAGVAAGLLAERLFRRAP